MISDDSRSPAKPGGGFCEAMDAAPVMIWVSGADKLRCWFNKPWLAFTGRTIEQERGDGWTGGFHPEDFQRCLEVYRAQFDARETFRMQYRLRRSDGVYRWIEDTGVPRYAPDGRFLGFIGSCSDIHRHVETEAELRELKRTLDERIGEKTTQLEGEIAARHVTERTLQESSTQLEVLIQGIKDCAIYLLDPEGRVSSWNSGAERIKGYSAGEILGEHFSRFYSQEDRTANVPLLALQRAKMEGKFEAEGWRLRKDGTRFWASVLIDPIYDDAGGLIGFGKITRDMTERRLAQEQLDQAQATILQAQKMEAVGQLTGGVAHDFNNLLMVILGNLEIAARHAASEARGSPRLKRAIDNAGEGARRAATLTQKLLAFSRRQPLAPKPLDLNKFIAEEVEFLQRTLGENIEVRAFGGEGLWWVEADLNQLEAALLNLAVNARDAMPNGGKLTIETGNVLLDEDYCRANPEVQPGQYVLLSVTDNGTGMTEEVLGKAIEPFFSTKAAGHGTGLGLSQIYGFIRQSGGHLKLYSEPGVGTCVKAYLPRCDAVDDLHRQETRAEATQGDPKETILLVEDNDDVRAYLIETLCDLKYSVLPARDAASALDVIENADIAIDLLLTDIVLPGLNGRELARKAQQLREGLKVLFMTGYSRNAIVHQGRLDRDVELVQKPVTQAVLAARIRAMLDR
jgi:PAS domain S-box-containing protein